MTFIGSISGMFWSDYAPLIVTIGAIVAAIIVITVFATLWGPVSRRINGDNRVARFEKLSIDELKGREFSIHLQSGNVLEGVMVLGFTRFQPNMPLQLRALLKLKLRDGTEIYLRADQIEYFKEVTPTDGTELS